MKLVGYPKVIPIPSLKTLGSFVFELCCRQTDRHTELQDTQTEVAKCFIPQTVTGVSNYTVLMALSEFMLRQQNVSLTRMPFR